MTAISNQFSDAVNVALDRVAVLPEVSQAGIGREAIAREVDVRHEELLSNVGSNLSDVHAAIGALDRRNAEVEAAVRNTLATNAGGVAVLILAIMGLIAGGLFLINPTVGRPLLVALRTPWSHGWWTGAFWTIAAAAFGVLVTAIADSALFSERRRERARLALGVAVADTVLSEARQQLIEAVYHEVRALAVVLINQSRPTAFVDRIFATQDAPPGRRTIGVSLSETARQDLQVPSAALHRARRLLTELPGGSIGVAGPRGIGKSTLLAALCAIDSSDTGDDMRGVAINTAAPVEYESRDFLLHIFSSLCRRVLDYPPGHMPPLDGATREPIERWQTQLITQSGPVGRIMMLFGTLTLVASVVIAAIVADNTAPTVTSPPPTANTASTSGLASAGATTPTQPVVGGKAAALAKTAQAAPDGVSQRPNAAASGPAVKPVTLTAALVEAAKTAQKTAPKLVPSPAKDQPSGKAQEAWANAHPLAALVKAFDLKPGPLALFGFTAVVLGLVLVVQSQIDKFTRNLLEAFATVWIWRYRRPRRQRTDPHVVALDRRSRSELDNIHFQRSYTSGWSGGLKAPVGIELGTTGAATLSRTPMSQPELVERFRAYVAEVVAARGRVIIGIDELDKLRSSADAEAFLNSVKSVFNIRGCYFLISVSEHAMASFDRRGIGFRNAFDSALDTVLHVDYCDLAGSKAVLDKRVLLWPAPFLHLSHMLSGGLPRDLIRSARDILALAVDRGAHGLAVDAAAAEVLKREAQAKIRATAIALRQLDENVDANALMVQVMRLSLLETIDDITANAVQLRAVIEATPGPEETRRQTLVVQELCVFLAILALIKRVAALAAGQAGWTRVLDTGLSEKVAQARQAIEASLPLAVVRLDDAVAVADGIEAALTAPPRDPPSGRGRGRAIAKA